MRVRLGGSIITANGIDSIVLLNEAIDILGLKGLKLVRIKIILFMFVHFNNYLS